MSKQFHIDQQVLSDYPLLGAGLSGEVYGYDQYAVKWFKPDACEKRDAEMLHKLQDHLAFPALHESHDDYIVTERIKGTPLAQLRHAEERIPQDYYKQVEEIVSACFDHGIIAQDLHLNNVMIDEHNMIKLIDVGRFFHTEHRQDYLEDVADQLESLRYYCGLFGSSRKRHKRKAGSSKPRRKSKYRSSSSSSSRPHRKSKYKSSSS